MPRRGKYIAPVDEQAIGKRLRELRRRRGLTQAEIGERLGITQTLVSEYERGNLRVHGPLVAAFAKELKVSADEILGLVKLPDDGIFRDRRFLRRLQKIERLSTRNKLLLLRNIDIFLKGVGVQ
jgi:transcriptional regulator with XRE-family HTH domain